MGPTGVHAGSTKIISVDRWPAANVSLSTPENVTTTARTNIVSTASQGMGATSVPSVMRMTPLTPRPPYANARAGRLPGKSTVISRATEPKIANNGVCEPLPMAKPDAAASGSTIAARTARRAASCSGSRSLIRSIARRQRPAGVSMLRMVDRRVSPRPAPRRTGRSPTRRASGRRPISGRRCRGAACACS